MSPEPQLRRPAEKRRHPLAAELVGGLDLSPKALRERPDAAELAPIAELMANAEYWIAFEVASFDPLLLRCPSPLRELGVGVALRFCESVDGQLSAAELDAARAQLLPGLPADVASAIEEGLSVLAHFVTARDAAEELKTRGFTPYAPSGGLSIAGLRSLGRAEIYADGEKLDRDGALPLGVPVVLTATDERGKALPAPEVESDLGAPLLAQSDDGERSVVLLVPGRYRLRVPGRSEGVRNVLAR